MQAPTAEATGQQQPALMSLVRLMAQVVLQHDKALQLQHRQECFILFVQSSPGSAQTVLTQQTLEGHRDGAPEMAQPAHLPPQEPDPGTSAETGEALPEQCASSTVGHGGAGGSDPGRRQLAVSEVVPFHQEADQLPRILQIGLRDNEVWQLLEKWTQSTLWTLIGVS